MITRLLLLLGCCLWGSVAFAQMTNTGYPVSWGIKQLSNKIDRHVMPAFDLQQIQQEDAINDPAWDRPWRFGYSHTTALNLQNSGTWQQLPNGDRLWRIELHSPNALTMNVVFDDYRLPDGATIYLYNPVTRQYFGAYTSTNNNPERVLGSTIVDGEDLVIEYFEPANVQGQGALQIAQVVHGYRTIQTYPTLRYLKGLNTSGDCNHDVSCPVGTGWQDQINSVAMLVANGNGFCSGALVNNTSNDGTPYFLGANHCGTGSVGSWVVRFNWESTTPICASTSSSVAPSGPRNEVNGAVLRANNAGSDFSLVELNSAPTGNVYYAGWDRSTTPASQTTGIHHPDGDLKKICRDNNPASINTWNGASVWEVSDWDVGVTEGGSSGSPLFNQNKLIVGQLYGGGAACSGTNDNNRPDYYGRFDVSWNGSSASTRLRDWLDPTGTNVTTLQGYDPNGPGLANDAGVSRILNIEDSYCNTGTVSPQVEIFNYGSAPLTSVNLIYDVDNGPSTTFNWTGSLAPNAATTIVLPSFTVGAGAHTFNAATDMPNNVVDSNTTNDARIRLFSTVLSGTPVDYFLELDCYGNEITWEITDSINTSNVIASGGPYNRNLGSAIDTIRENLCLPAGCYRLVIRDSYGDGLYGAQYSACGRSGSYGIFNGNTQTALVTMTAPNADFGNIAEHFFCVGGAINVNKTAYQHQVTLFPNPTTGQVYLTLELPQTETVQLTLFSATGQQLWQNTPTETGSTTLEVDLSQQPAGVYWVRAQVGDSVYTKKVVRY